MSCAPPGLGTTTTLGGNSLLMRASPAMSFTRTGVPKLRPAFRLTAVNTSVVFAVDADQATTTRLSRAAIDAFALLRPSTARCTWVSDDGGASPRQHAASPTSTAR